MNSTIIGVPKEIKDNENRVAMLPSAAYQLIKKGHTVIVQRNAGAGASYLDDEYESAGAKMVDTAEGVFSEAKLIVKVKEPQPPELALLKPEHTLFTYLHLAASQELTEGLMASGCTAIAYETIEVNGLIGSLPYSPECNFPLPSDFIQNKGHIFLLCQ